MYACHHTRRHHFASQSPSMSSFAQPDCTAYGLACTAVIKRSDLATAASGEGEPLTSAAINFSRK